MAKRIMKPMVNWAELEKRVPPEQKPQYYAFKGKSDAYWRRVESYPPEPPKIDWEAYKKIVPVEGLVDKFKQEYESFKVPYPEDTMTSQVEDQWNSVQEAIKAFCAKSESNIKIATDDLNKIKALPPLEETTMEMFYDLCPDQAIDPVNNPTFWPHNEEEQPWYKPPVQPHAEGGH